MLVGKSYQDSPSLQAIPNITNTVNKVFLYIFDRLQKDPKAVITRGMIAKAVGLKCLKSVSNATNELQDNKMLTKSRRPGYYNDVNCYKITTKGRMLIPYLRNLYKVVVGIFKRPLLSVGLLLSLAASSFPLLKEDIYKNPPLKRKLLTHARARRVAMSTPIEAKEMLAAQDLLNLSKWGTIRLSAYPRQAIEYASTAFRSSKSKKEDPFNWFCSLCDQWCKRENIEPNLPQARILAREHEMPSNPEWIVPRPVLVIPEKKKQVVSERRTAMTEEQGFIHRVHALDKLGQMSELNEYARIVQANLAKQVQPFMETPSVLKIEEVEVVEVMPTEWSQTDKQLVDWALGYIDTMTLTKHAYVPFVQEILLGPNSPRARSGELQAGLKLMQRLYFKEMASRLEQTPITKVVTELKDQIVCAQIANDEKVWDNLTYSPVEGDELYEEIY